MGHRRRSPDTKLAVAAFVAFAAAATGCGRVGFDPVHVEDDGGLGDPRLASIALSNAGEPVVNPMMPSFDADTFVYQVEVGLVVQSLELAAVPLDPSTTITIDTVPIAADAPSAALPLALGATTFVVVGTSPDGATASYTVMITRASALAQQAYVKASNTDAQDQFGYSVSMSGDTLAVGAHVEASDAIGIDGDQTNNAAMVSGAVYVFTRTAGVWSQQAYLKASNTGASDQFGFQVALSGDTLAVGAIGEASAATGVDGDQTDNTAAGAGAVYVFTRSGTTWSQQAYLKASNTAAGDAFGGSLSLSGDTLAAGSEFESSHATGIDGNELDISAPKSGAVYVFARTGSTWAQQAYIKASNTSANGLFAYTVSVSGDTLAVSAVGEASNATGIDGDQTNTAAMSSGAVYVFTRTGTTWTQQAYIKASNTGAGDQFGTGLSVFGDTLAVGALGEASHATGIDGDQSDNSAGGSGAAYVFTRTGQTWTQQAYIKASNTDAGDSFGFSLSLSSAMLAVGAFEESSDATGIDGNQADNSIAGVGAVYVFVRDGQTWSQQAYVKPSNHGRPGLFGYNVSASGDTLAAGAFLESSDATGIDGNQADVSDIDAGAAYVFE